jgi:hypothetical protein
MSTSDSILEEPQAFLPHASVAAYAAISGMDAYRALVAEAERDYAGFWARRAREMLDWKRPFSSVLDESRAPFYEWFNDGTLNASYNCLDRHVEAGNGEHVAVIFEADDGTVTRVTYRQLLERVSRFANALRTRGVKKDDRVVIYMPMSIEGIVAMQACARIGATHSVVFGGFSSKSLNERIVNVGAIALVTCDVEEYCGRSPCDGRLRGGEKRHRLSAHGRQGRMARRARPLDARVDASRSPYVRAGMGGRGTSALHSLYVWLNGCAEGRAAQHGRFPDVGRADHEVDIRRETQ